MYISKDFSYINANETTLIDNGYGKLSVYSIHFDRHYSEEQKEKNRKTAESMTKEEWSRHCDKIAEEFAKPLNEILEKFLSKYSIYQASENVSYDSDWDLFFWSDKGWNGKDFMTHFKLNFNEKRSPEQNMALLDEIISFIETMEYENIGCRIQYNAIMDNERIETEAKTICEKLVGKFIDYHGMTGKIKVVKEENGIKEYGFFKKNAKNKYYSISNSEILTMNMYS